MKQFVLMLGLLLAFGSVVGTADALPVLVDGDFQSGNLNDWTTFTTTNGRIAPLFPPGPMAPFPRVDSFDVNGDGSDSLAALFMVGVELGNPLTFQGGGIYQNFSVSAVDAGSLSIGLDIAVSGTANGSGGWFELLVDNAVIAQHNFGSILIGAPVERASLFGTASLAAGSHELRIRMRRASTNIGGMTPIQYLDNITFSSGSGGLGGGAGNGNGNGNGGADNNGAPIPEPASMTLIIVGMGLLGAGRLHRRSRS